MAHIGEKLGFGGVCEFGGIARIAQFIRRLLADAHLAVELVEHEIVAARHLACFREGLDGKRLREIAARGLRFHRAQHVEKRG